MILLRFDIRGVAQLVAYLVWDQRVVSSSLATPTKEKAFQSKLEGFFSIKKTRLPVLIKKHFIIGKCSQNQRFILFLFHSSESMCSDLFLFWLVKMNYFYFK